MSNLRFILAPFALLAGSSIPAVAQTAAPTVLEVFVSKNCPNCPKAHRNLSQMRDDGHDFLQLTWSVNYWDYLGDPDPMAIAQSTTRQDEYVTRMSLGAPYTPQAFVNGDAEAPAARKRALAAALRTVDEPGDGPAISLSATETHLNLDGSGMENADVYLLRVTSLEIEGRWLENAVLGMRQIGEWNGGPMDIAYDCAERCVALVQEAGAGPIRAALELTATKPELMSETDGARAVPTSEP